MKFPNPRIIHRDIKAGNILLNKKLEVKIADFGLAKWFPDERTHITTRVAGTKGYLAPEYAARGQLMEKQYILDWARSLRREGKLEEMIDPGMRVVAIYLHGPDLERGWSWAFVHAGGRFHEAHNVSSCEDSGRIGSRARSFLSRGPVHGGV